MDLSSSKKELESHVDELGKPYVSFFTGLWDLEESIEPVAWSPADAEALAQAMMEGTTAFSVDHPVLTQEYLLEHIGSVIAYISLFVDEFVAVNKDFSELKKEYEMGARSIPEDILSQVFTAPELLTDEVAELLELKPETDAYQYLRLAIATVLEPTAHAAAEQLKFPEELGFDTGVCPVCGQQATIGVLKAAGEMSGSPRELHCSLCGSNWSFPRIKCTWCGSTNQEDLSYIFDESDINKRVYTCRKCGGTQKVIVQDARTGMGDLRANELLMLPLEEAAVEQQEASAQPDAE